MSNQWRVIPIEEAKRHELYGIGGWLAFFAVSHLLGMLSAFGNLGGEAASAGMSLGELFALNVPFVGFIKTFLLLNFSIAATIWILLFTKNRNFRKWASTLMIIQFPALLVLASMYSFDGLGVAVVKDFFSWAISCAVWVTYLQRSKRVRVTFEHSVRTQEQPNVHQKPTNKETEKFENNGAPIQPDQSRAPIFQTHVKTTENPIIQTSLSTVAAYEMPSDIEESFWERAAGELANDTVRPGAWAKCFSEADGNESLAKASYMKYRVAQFIIEWQKEQAAQAALIESQSVHNRYVASLSNSEKSIYDALAIIQGNSNESFGATIKLIEFLGGSAKWDSDRSLRSRWFVEFDGQKHSFNTDEALAEWAAKHVIPHAKNLIRPVIGEQATNSNRSEVSEDIPKDNAIVYPAVENMADAIKNQIALVELDGSHAFSALMKLIRILGGDARWDLENRSGLFDMKAKLFNFSVNKN